MLALLTPLLGPRIASALLGPLGKYLLIGLVVVGWTLYQRHDAATKAREECQAEQLRAEIAEIKRQQDATEAALAAAEKQQQTTDAELASLEAERDQIKKDAAAASGQSCKFAKSTLQRLRNIR